jgi:hypothetical protein
LITDLARGLLAALIAGVLPGYFWAGFVRRTDGLAERLAYSTAISLATVPAVAVLLAHLAGSGISLLIALGSVVIVAGSGALATRIWGAAGGSAAPALPRPRAVRNPRVLALLIVGIALALAVSLGVPARGWLLIVILVAVAVAGLATRGYVGPAQHDAPRPAGRPMLGRAVRAPALVVILALTAVRGYAGVVGHDWPFVRGEDQFSHAVMTEQMLAHGNYATYLIYPPGFSALSAVISRFSGLPPLSLFPVVTPALLLLTTLAAYALATRLWGWEYGLAAAALSGLVLIGPYVSFGGGLYPDLLAAFFLMVMFVAALVSLYQSPSIRTGLLVAVVGAAVVLFHSVGTLYLVVLLAAVVLVCLPYLALRAGREGRRTALALTLSLAGLGVLSLAYAWHIYGLGPLLSGHGVTGPQVGLDVGSQSVLPAGDLLSWVGSPIIWLGLFGFVALAAAVRYLRRPDQVATALTILLWCAVMYLGSRTSADGFPQRFERDVGAPLSILAALGVGMIFTSLVRPALARRRDAVPAEPIPVGHSPVGSGANGSGANGSGANGSVPVSSVPASSASVGSASASSASVASVAANSASLGSVPASSVPASSVPASSVPASSVPASSVPASSVPASSVPASSASASFALPTGSAPSDLGPEGAELSEPGPVSTLVASQGDAEPGSTHKTAPVVPAAPDQRRHLLDRSRLRRPPAAAVLASAVVVVIGAVQAGSDLKADSAPSNEVLPRPVAAAGAWLDRHNTGGNIISTPDLNRGVTNRAVLAMGGYTGLQSYPEARIEHPRSLPTGGRRPLLDSREVLLNPVSCRSGHILAAQDVRYIVLYKFTNQANYGGFVRDPQRYRQVFENQSMIIYASQHRPAPSC